MRAAKKPIILAGIVPCKINTALILLLQISAD